MNLLERAGGAAGGDISAAPYVLADTGRVFAALAAFHSSSFSRLLHKKVDKAAIALVSPATPVSPGYSYQTRGAYVRACVSQNVYSLDAYCLN